MKPGQRLRFMLERYLVRGAHYQLLAVAALIGIISVLGGALVRWGAGAEGGAWESFWWAFLRLTDPGYLGDDTGFFRCTVSTVLTVMGYVLFMGSLVAILTQWLNSTMRRFEAGFTPVARKNHVLILGWTPRAGIVIRNLFLSEGRVRRFLKRRGARRLHIVLMADEVGHGLMQEIRTRVGEAWNPRQITLRSGSALRGDHLSRVDFLRSAVILLPVGEFSEAGPENADTHTIKTLLSLSNHALVRDAAELPLAVAEVIDARKETIAQKAYRGPIEVLAGEALVSRLITQSVRHPGLSNVYNELLMHAQGNELYVRELPDLAGASFESLGSLFPNAVVLGVVRCKGKMFRPYINPGPGFVVEKDDRMILMSRSYEASQPSKCLDAEAISRGSHALPAGSAGGSHRVETRRVLILGWSHKAPALIAEFASYPNENFSINVVSTVPVSRRESAVERYGADCGRIQLAHQEADYTVWKDLERIDPAGYDNIVMLASDWLPTGEESDARTLVGVLLLQEMLSREACGTSLLVELMGPENVGLLGKRTCDVLVSPVILSNMLALVSMRRELSCVFDELFTTQGPEIVFFPVAGSPLQGRSLTFSEIEKEVCALGGTALGVHVRSGRTQGSELRLNPDKTEVFRLENKDEIAMVATYE